VRKKLKINTTEESIFTLLSLFVLIQQALESIYGKEEILNSEFDSKNNSFHNLMTDTIHEALNYQILLKTCAFLDEWNKIFGISTEQKDFEKIKGVKKLAKPAIKHISGWKQLKDFRNEAIAHNHRENKSGKNIYLISKGYNFPDTDSEIYLMVFCIKKSMDVVSAFFKAELENVIKKLKFRKIPSRQKRLSAAYIKRTIKEINSAIDNPVAYILMSQHLLGSVIEAFDKRQPTNTILH
jgi:hypothetical protein